MKVIIVGGVAGGASAAARLRRLDESAQIILLEKGKYISYANCGLPYFIGGVIQDKERLIVTKPKLLRNRFQIDVRTENEAIRIDPEKKIVTIRRADSSEYEETYDKLLLSPGAQPKRPPFPGISEPGIFTLRTVPDALAIDAYLRETNAKQAVVVGAGFIGVEMAENLRERGLDVTIVEFLPQAIASLDPEMAAILHRHLRERGITLFFNTGVEAFKRTNGTLEVSLNTGATIPADLVILSIGVAPENGLAKEAGLELGVGGGIAVDDMLRTSSPDIYAVGDAACTHHLISDTQTLLPLAGPANRQGRAAAENMLGGSVHHANVVQGSAVLKVFDLTAASTGLTEKQLRKDGTPYLKTYIHPAAHATYYPGAAQISMKLLYRQDGTLLGAQAVGREGVEKRIDVLSTVMHLHGTVYDLERLELCYAPPYSSAKDPVNMLGFTAGNILRGLVKQFHYEDVDGLDRSAATLLDVRTSDEAMLGALDGAVNIPLDELRNRLGELPKEKPVYAYCQVGLRGYVACRILTQNGYDAYNLSGGMKTYQTAKEDAEPPLPVDCAGLPKTTAPTPAQVETPPVAALNVDACGLQCPGPIMKLSEGVKSLADGQTLSIRATDPAFASDVSVWCERTGNHLLGVTEKSGVYAATLQKGAQTAACPVSSGNGKAMVVFSGDLDKALATFIIANGAASMGRSVTLFFTFWGLNILRRDTHIALKKGFLEKMFGIMMPRGSRKLGLSRMNMGGMGAKMIRGVMKQKNVQSLEELIAAAVKNGVRLVACQMSMDIMGIRHEELIDGVETGGVATFLGSAELSDTSLFI